MIDAAPGGGEWNASALSSIIVAGLALVSSVAAGWMTLRGKREETATTIRAQEYRNLVEGQDAWMTRMEARLKALEASNDDLRARARREEEYTHMLRLALRRAVEYLRTLSEWASGPQEGPPPLPDLAELEEVLEATTPPTARLPPTD